MNDQRECQLYRFYVSDPRTNYTTKTLGYIGETGRLPFQRLMEHIYEQPWADTIVGWEVDGTLYPNKASVLAAEEAAIKTEKPLYNVEHNMGNRRRIKPWEAERQAAERGRMLRPRPRVSQDPAPRPATPRKNPRSQGRTTPRKTASQDPPRWFASVLVTAVVWLLLSISLWVVRPDGGPKSSAGWATGFVLAAWFVSKRKRRRPARRRR